MDDKRTNRGENGNGQPLVTLAVFMGMVLVSALLCVVIWTITHRKAEVVVLPTNESSVVEYVGTTDTTEESTEQEETVDTSDIVVTSDGREVVFVDCDNVITPKEYVNIRTEPSTAGGESTVYCKANAGEQFHRTGISPDFGWSRIEYEGQILYVVTSNVEAVEE